MHQNVTDQSTNHNHIEGLELLTAIAFFQKQVAQYATSCLSPSSTGVSRKAVPDHSSALDVHRVDYEAKTLNLREREVAAREKELKLKVLELQLRITEGEASEDLQFEDFARLRERIAYELYGMLEPVRSSQQ